jgi:hypothetical protein
MAQKEKNIFLVFPFTLNALEIRNMNNGVAENAYKASRIFILSLYHLCGEISFSFRIYIVCPDITFASKQHKQILFL